MSVEGIPCVATYSAFAGTGKHCWEGVWVKCGKPWKKNVNFWCHWKYQWPEAEWSCSKFTTYSMLLDVCWSMHRRNRWRRKPTRCYSVFYWTCNRLNMFRAPLCSSSGALDCTTDYHMSHLLEQQASARTLSQPTCAWPSDHQQPRCQTVHVVISGVV
jgi:hypothetical protein